MKTPSDEKTHSGLPLVEEIVRGRKEGKSAARGGPPDPFDDLDAPLLLKVFEYVDLYERLNVLPRVCRRFRAVAWDERECRRIYNRRFSTREVPGVTYLARLRRSAQFYREEELSRDNDSIKTGVALTPVGIATRIALSAALSCHEIVLREALSDVARGYTSKFDRRALDSVDRMVLDNDDVRCFEVLLDARLSKDPHAWPGVAQSETETFVFLAYLAASSGALNCLGVLKDRGMDFRCIGPVSFAHPLSHAVLECQVACAEFLLEQGITHPVRSTPEGTFEPVNLFSFAAGSRSGRAVEMIEFLRRNPPHIPRGLGSPELTRQWLADARDVALSKGTADAFRYLLGLAGNPADPVRSVLREHSRDDEPDEIAEKLRAVINFGADIDAPLPDEVFLLEKGAYVAATPLQAVFARGDLIDALYFLGLGADPNAHTTECLPPLHLVIDSSNRNVRDVDTRDVFVVRALLYFGADPRLKFFHPRHGSVDAMELARRERKTSILRVLRQHASPAAGEAAPPTTRNDRKRKVKRRPKAIPDPNRDALPTPANDSREGFA